MPNNSGEVIQSEICIFVPTRRYSLYHELQQKFWSKTGVNLLIADKENTWLTQSGTTNIYPNKIEENNLESRILKSESIMPGKYVLWLGEDDLVFLPGFLKALNKTKILNQKKSSSLFSVYSPPRSFDLNFLSAKRKHGEYIQRYSTLNDSALERMKEYIKNPIDRHFYAVLPKKVFFAAFRTIASNNTISMELWERLFPSFFDLICTAYLKTYHENFEWYLKGESGNRLDNSFKETCHVPNYLTLKIEKEKFAFEIWKNKIAKYLERDVPETQKFALNFINELTFKLISRELQANIEYLKKRDSTTRLLRFKLSQVIKSYGFRCSLVMNFYSTSRRIIMYLNAVRNRNIPWSILRISSKFRDTAKLIIFYRKKTF